MNEDSVIQQQLHLLLTAYGYNLYNSNNRARADDLLVRQRASASIGDAASHLGEVATDYAAHHIPPSTRENPYPPREQMAQLEQMNELKDQVSTLGALIRAMPAPTQDRTWARIRSESGTLNALLRLDCRLITVADAILHAVQNLSADAWAADRVGELRTQLAEMNTITHERDRLLQAPF
ncbi:MAG: hypothetical protein M3Y56_03250 [Armatimonadota bacterium]|nr:hypothetical protein [Armatimonadota bacterium]